MLFESWVDSCPLTALEKSFSIALALAPHVSTSNVPFTCLELVKLYFTESRLVVFTRQSSLPRNTCASLERSIALKSFLSAPPHCVVRNVLKESKAALGGRVCCLVSPYDC